MSLKRLACVACSAALLLGACSGNNPGTGTSNGGGSNPDAGGGSGGGNGNGGDDGDGSNGGPVSTELQEANTAYEKAKADVAAANMAIEDRAEARSLRLIATATQSLAAAVQAAEAAVQAARSGSAAALGAATNALERARDYQRIELEKLNTAQGSFAWYRTPLARYKFANGVAVVPKDGTNKVTIVRIPRTRDTSATDTAQIANTGNTDKTKDAFTDTTFVTVPYADGKRALVASDDEFKVDGYTTVLSSNVIDERNPRSATGLPIQRTGLKLTSDGLVIRTGGTAPIFAGSIAGDFTDMRRDITKPTSDTNNDGSVTSADGTLGQNGWDLAITFDEPQTMPVVGGETSWTGNGDFYWRAIVPAASSQLETDGDYYQADAFLQPDNFKDLGTYEVWLSNHIGVDRNAEPAPGFSTVCPNGVRGTSCPDDDDQLYLNYAAYGMFVYTADTQTFPSPPADTGQKGRMQTIHYGYSAFADETGKRTTDIGQAIINGRFRGQTLAYAVKGNIGAIVDTALLRGDATLTLTIPKTTGSGTIRGTLNNFEQWRDSAWENFGGMSIALQSTTISNAGEFSGTTAATGRTDLSGEAGNFRGSFYGPRSDRDDLEVAGSYNIGTFGANSYTTNEWSIMGSFGAKKRLLTQ